MHISKKTIVLFECSDIQAERLAADLMFILSFTEDLPAKIKESHANEAIDARTRLGDFVESLRKVVSRK